ncbi:ribokinase [Lactiplantibacillus garii]|uniref:Ribokinase n=1 Tax=Lactiplantibacillus garii TaxID=2306423 RepID=A0A426D4V3_9LACO|nr:ribokinase [Lactiplantibacillus garii]RRK09594.1 ribokinase [Lactiplantibacillus garii]
MVNKIAVLGSLNVDTTLSVQRMPEPGETLAVSKKKQAAGGKGANQAIAAARSQAETMFIGQVGQDEAGQMMIQALKDDGVDVSHIYEDSAVATGSATILLDANGQNEILVFGGANQNITGKTLNLSGLAGQDFLITQFETPQPAALAAFKQAKADGVLTILNPAPAHEILPELLPLTDLIVPNETESALLTGIEVTDLDSMQANAAAFKKMGIPNTIITVGSRGAFFATANHTGFMPAFKVHAKDTTAAGDTFIGALASQLDSDFSNIEAATQYAQRASSITVQRYGALPSIPTKDEIISANAEVR